MSNKPKNLLLKPYIRVNKSLFINSFGICVGEFQNEVLQIDTSSFYCFYINNIKEAITWTFQEGQLLQKTKDFFKGYLGLDIIKNFKIVLSYIELLVI